MAIWVVFSCSLQGDSRFFWKRPKPIQLEECVREKREIKRVLLMVVDMPT